MQRTRAIEPAVSTVTTTKSATTSNRPYLTISGGTQHAIVKGSAYRRAEFTRGY